MGKREDLGNRRPKKLKRCKVSRTPNAKIQNVETPSHTEGTLAEEYGAEEEIVCVIEDEQLSANEDTEVCLDIKRNDADHKTTNPEKGNIVHPTDVQQTHNNKKVNIISKRTAVPIPTTLQTSPTTGKKTKKRKNSGTSSDEERWLTAIESGKLDDVDDELKKMKDPKLMTARQRAMYERSHDKEPSPGGELLMALPSGYREKEKPQTAEEIQKAVLKSQKRKQQADERREKDKKKTMERLLKKQDSNKLRGAAARNKTQKPALPMVSYRNNIFGGGIIQMPAGYEFPLQRKHPREPPKPKICGVKGCNQRKVYNCAKSNIPLCSLTCYRKNLLNAHR